MLSGLYPAFVDSYNKKTRRCRVRIPSVTDGAEIYPEAEFSYNIGDNSSLTEVRIKKDDPIWIEFQKGDARHPVIIGYRPAHIGNELVWRRFEGERIELKGDAEIFLVVEGVSIQVTSSQININGNVIVNGDVIADGISLKTHTHGGVASGSSSTGSPS